MKTKYTLMLLILIALLPAFAAEGYDLSYEIITETVEQPEYILYLGRGEDVEIEFVWIPPGEYRRGARASPAEIKDIYGGRAAWYEDEHPSHMVRFKEGFWMSKTPVTQAQYLAIMDLNPSEFEGDDLPVEGVCWTDVTEFLEKLNTLYTGYYRLPTEAEWEYACRAGTETEHYFGDDVDELDNYAWYEGNSGMQTHPVGSKKPNPWGLYDMHGNVWEWCSDWYGEYPDADVSGPKGADSGTFRVIRGGSWSSGPRYCRSAYRGVNHARNPVRHRIGFRLVLVPDE